MSSVTTGANNTALGYVAGDNITTGSSNIIIGSGVDAPLATADSQINIGNVIFSKSTRTIQSKSANGIGVFEAKDSISLADDATLVLSGNAGGYLLTAYETGSGHGAVYWITYSNAVVMLSGDSLFVNSDTDSKFCVYKSGSSHTVTIKNRLGSTKNFYISAFGGFVGT